MSAAQEVAIRFEVARASGRWEDAWRLLAPLSQLRLRSILEFAEAETSFNAAGGARFAIRPPTRDDVQLQLFVGAMREDIAREADVRRGALVVVDHPEMASASVGTMALFVAPLESGEWRVWIVQ